MESTFILTPYGAAYAREMRRKQPEALRAKRLGLLRAFATPQGALVFPDWASGIRDAVIAMAGFSTYLSDAILNHVFRTTKYTAPGTVYAALHASDPTGANLATELAIGTGAYARVAMAVSDATWTAPASAGSARQITNASNVTFPTPTADWNAGSPITWASLKDAPTVGNLLASGALGTPRTVLLADNAPVFGPGSLVLSLA